MVVAKLYHLASIAAEELIHYYIRESKETDFRRSKKLRRKGNDLLPKKKLGNLRKRKNRPGSWPLPNRKLQLPKLTELLLKKPLLMPWKPKD